MGIFLVRWQLILLPTLFASLSCSRNAGSGGDGQGGAEPTDPEPRVYGEALGGAPATTASPRKLFERFSGTDGARTAIEARSPLRDECTPGSYACPCTDNHTCDAGMDCIGNICGDVSRWGEWTESDNWPAAQAIIWGSGSDGDSTPVADGGLWQ